MFEPKHLKRWTMPDHYAGEVWPSYYSAGIGISRDSSDLENSNFDAMLRALGGEDSEETIVIVREGHWAVGWVEWIAIHQDNEKALRIADELMERLQDYPVLDEDDFSRRELEHADQVWANYSWQERIAYMRENYSHFAHLEFRELLACARGHFFGGYPSELIGS